MTERQVESVLIEIPKGSRNKYEYDKEKKSD
ncbi:inorganic diphosphatase [Methanosarcina barkeri]|nr:inorganic diphosphatase [Methanosarcina barkeri]